MMPHRTLPAIVGGILMLALGPAVHAGTTVVLSSPAAKVVVTPPAGLGVWIGKPAPVAVPVPARREVVVTPHPWRHRFIRIGPPYRVHPAPVIVPRPVAQRVVVESPVVVENCPITVWITNSNGSRSSVTLTRQGGYYIGPRGEYYTGLPTNEQLRVVYGF